jgi:hypothetical protein
MTPQEFTNRVKELEVFLQNEFPEINERAALSASALVKNRVINSGVNGDDKYLGEYEDTPYKKKRQKAGHQTDYVDLNFSGQMFRDIGVVRQVQDGSVIRTQVGPKNTKARKGGVKTSDIAEGNAERYGNFMKPNKEEIEMIGKQISRDVTKAIKQVFT